MPRWEISRYLCTDPGEYGHANVLGTPQATPTDQQRSAEDEAAEAARKTDERRRVRQRNTEWRAATEVRTIHLKELLARKIPPAGALTLIAEAMARGETQPVMSSFGHETACELLMLKGGGGATIGHRDLLLTELAHATEKRAQVIALAMVLGAAEHGVRDAHTWQHAEGKHYAAYGVPRSARYLAWLAEHTGYELSGIEAEVAAHAAPDDSPAEDEAAETRVGLARLRMPTRTRPRATRPARPRAGARRAFPPGGHRHARPEFADSCGLSRRSRPRPAKTFSGPACGRAHFRIRLSLACRHSASSGPQSEKTFKERNFFHRSA